MDTEKLILLVRQNSVFYDSTHPRYNDVKFKKDCWRDIGQNLNQPGAVCKKSWINLRDSFRKVLRTKVQIKTGQVTGRPKSWRFEKEMSFLIPFYQERKAISNFEGDYGLGDDESSGNLMEGTVEETAPSELSEHPAVVEESYKNPEQDSIRPHFLAKYRPSKPLKRRRSSSGYRRESTSSTLTSYILQEKYDPLTSFFSSIANTMRTFSPYHQALAKSKIFSVISEMEMNQVQDWRQSSSNPPRRASSPPHSYEVPRVFLSPSSSEEQASEDVETSYRFPKVEVKDSEEISEVL